MPLLTRNTTETVANQGQLDKHHGKSTSRFSRVLPLGIFHRSHEGDHNDATEALQVHEARTAVTPTRNDDEQSPRDEDVGHDEISENCEAVPVLNGQDDREGAGMISLLKQALNMSSPSKVEQSASTKESHHVKNEETKMMINKRSGILATFLSSHENKKVSTSLKDSQDTMKNRGTATTKSLKLSWRSVKLSRKKKHSSSKFLTEELKDIKVTNEEDDCPEVSLMNGDVTPTSFLVIRPTTPEKLSLDQDSYESTNGEDEDDDAKNHDKLINHERTKRGLLPLRSSDYLNSLAKSHAIVMAEHGMLGHSVENLVDLQLQLHSMDVGENIQSGSSMKQMHISSMKDGTSNRMNILRESYLEYGYGSAWSEDDVDGKLYQAQLFRGKPMVEKNSNKEEAVKEEEALFRKGEGLYCCVW